MAHIIGGNTIFYMVKQDNNIQCSIDTPLEMMSMLHSNESRMHAMNDIIQWLVLGIEVNIQHIWYNDLLGVQMYNSNELYSSEMDYIALKMNTCVKLLY